MTESKTINEKITTEQKSESSGYVPQKEMKSFKDAIERMRIEADFASKAFAGNTKEAKESLKSTMIELIKIFNNIHAPLKTFNMHNDKLELMINTLAVLPDKTENTLRELVPEIAKEIENIHDQRMASIESTLKGLQQDLHKEAGNQLNISKDLSEQLQKQSNEDLLKKQEMLEKAFNNRMEQMNKVQLQQVASQEKMFQKFVDHTKQEIDSVTSNHGSKFLRNTSICLILSVIAGGISGWYINKQFPRFVSFSKTGDVTIKHSHVKVWEANSVKNPNLNKK